MLTLQRDSSYVEKGSPENDSPYTGTTIKLPANVRLKPVTTVTPRLEPVQVPYPVAPVTPAVTPTPVAPTPVHSADARDEAGGHSADADAAPVQRP